MIRYELINPSDPITFVAPTFAAAVGAVVLLGAGKLGARAENDDADLEIPPLMVGDHEEWFRRKGIVLDSLLVEHSEDIATTLASFCTGSWTDREMYELALAAIPDDDWRAKFRADWDDKRRSSLSQITNAAHDLANRMRAATMTERRAPGDAR